MRIEKIDNMKNTSVTPIVVFSCPSNFKYKVIRNVKRRMGT